MSNLQRLLNRMMPNENDRAYVLTYLACGLHKYNINDKFLIIHGRANNGKTMLIKLLRDVTSNVKYICTDIKNTKSLSPGVVYVMEPECPLIPERDINILTTTNSYPIMMCNYIGKNNFNETIKDKLRCVNFPNKINWMISREEFDSYKDEFKEILDNHYAKFVENNYKMIESQNILDFTKKYINLGQMYDLATINTNMNYFNYVNYWYRVCYDGEIHRKNERGDLTMNFDKLIV